jgi:hypothetical protein
VAILLFVIAAVRLGARWLAGRHRTAGNGRGLLGLAAITGAAGLALVAYESNLYFVATGGCIYAVGAGTFHTAVFGAMLRAGVDADRSAVAAVWNASIDAGGLIAGLGLGAVATVAGPHAALWGMAAMMAVTAGLVALPSTRLVPPSI